MIKICLMQWHAFNVDDNKKEIDYEGFRWTNVMPGDIVQSKGSIGYKREDIYRRYDPGVKIYKLKYAPMLVLSRIPGIPGEESELEKAFVTFTLLTRHGILCVITDLDFAK